MNRDTSGDLPPSSRERAEDGPERSDPSGYAGGDPDVFTITDALPTGVGRQMRGMLSPSWNSLAGQDPRSDQESEVVVAVPAFNEASSIAAVVDAANEYADAVLVVDDGSDDDTAARAAAHEAAVVRHETNRGYGAALKTIFVEAARRDVDHLVVMDGDGQHEPADIGKLLASQREHDSEIVVGNRFEGDAGIPLYRRFGLEVINGMVWVALALLSAGFRIRDSQSGFRAYDRRAIRSLANDERLTDGMGASVDVLFHACRRGYDVREVDTTISYDMEETSTHNPVRQGLAIVNRVVRRVFL